MLSKFKKFGLRMPPPAQPGEINHPLIDRFTLVHFGVGVAYGYFGLHFGWVLFLAIFWEIIENPLKAYASFIFPHGTCDTFRMRFAIF